MKTEKLNKLNWPVMEFRAREGAGSRVVAEFAQFFQFVQFIQFIQFFSFYPHPPEWSLTTGQPSILAHPAYNVTSEIQQ